eukprot:4435781-Alexandrium_andersonii.AAC.1
MLPLRAAWRMAAGLSAHLCGRLKDPIVGLGYSSGANVCVQRARVPSIGLKLWSSVGATPNA